MRSLWTKSAMMMVGCTLLMSGVQARAADGASITTVRENGRVVWVNDDSAPAATQQESAPARRLEYWSVTEHRWKPVPRPTPQAMTAARSAAQEVAKFVDAKPATAVPAATVNPNYRDLARGHLVSNSEVDKAIEVAAQRHGVDANLVRAVIKVESNFNPRAVSSKGAMGLMQLMPATARSLKVTNPFDPMQNVEAGVRHLKTLLENFKGNVPLSLAAYNAGEKAVLKRHAVPEFAETKSYVRQITNIYAGGSIVTPGSKSARATPMRMYRGEDGTIRLTNEE